MARLAEQFVCVRVQSMNGVNINLFQFDYDLTWMAFFMDGQDRFYTRYGGREDNDAESHLTKESLVRVMDEVLRLHQASQPQASRYEPKGDSMRTPEQIPTVPAMIARRKEGQRCIHCHDVKNGALMHLQNLGQFSRGMIFTYPRPSAVGIHLEPDRQNRVRMIESDSPAARAGLKTGDVLRSLDGQRILTLADFSRVLDQAPDEGALPLELERDGQALRTTLELAGPWRRTGDPSWRASAEVAGPNPGFWAETLNETKKQAAGLQADALALRVSFLFPKHPTPPQAGLKLNDLVVEVAGNRKHLTTRQLHAHFQMNHDYGDRVPIIVRRDGRELELTLQLPAQRSPLE